MIDSNTPLFSQFQEIFGCEPEAAARAPGRVEFIGNHTDYNGGLVMGFAVEQGVTALVSPRTDRKCALFSLQGSGTVEADLDDLRPLEGPSAWANYPLGVVRAMVDAGARFENGFSLAVDGDLPAGAGLSSSAALELATAYALAELIGFKMDKLGFARIGRKAENEFVGVPCGILDQGVSAHGEAGKLVRIDCRTETFTTVDLGEDLNFWIFNTAKKHSLVESFYADRNAECREATRRLQAIKPHAEHLADFTVAEVRGAEELLTPVLLKRALHVAAEIERVRAVDAALAAGNIEAVGRAMFASHESSRALFENSIPELDFLVETLKAEPSVYGARLTGGGFGGAVVALAGPTFTPERAEAVAATYAARFGNRPAILETKAAAGAGILV